MSAPFGDFEFAVGTVRGLRSWHAEEAGLRSVSRKYIWRPGENTAHCYRVELCDCADCRAERDAMLAVSPHRMETCDCGFYAYFAPQIEVGSETYTRPTGSYTIGVIEAYGRTIVGTKGFRAQRARILALALNGTEPDASLSTWAAIAHERRLQHTGLAAHRLGVPLFTSVEELLAEFPTSSADDFRQQEVAS